MDFDEFKEYMGDIKDKIAEKLEKVNFGSYKYIDYIVKLGEKDNLPWEYSSGDIEFPEGLTDIYQLIPLPVKIKFELERKKEVDELKKKPKDVAEIEEESGMPFDEVAKKIGLKISAINHLDWALEDDGECDLTQIEVEYGLYVPGGRFDDNFSDEEDVKIKNILDKAKVAIMVRDLVRRANSSISKIKIEDVELEDPKIYDDFDSYNLKLIKRVMKLGKKGICLSLMTMEILNLSRA